jgi:hypothetical protein
VILCFYLFQCFHHTSAIIIGDKAGLDKEIKQAYGASGTMHFLAGEDIFIMYLFKILIINTICC